jgi:hypothetical protein
MIIEIVCWVSSGICGMLAVINICLRWGYKKGYKTGIIRAHLLSKYGLKRIVKDYPHYAEVQKIIDEAESEWIWDHALGNYEDSK